MYIYIYIYIYLFISARFLRGFVVSANLRHSLQNFHTNSIAKSSVPAIARACGSGEATAIWSF